MCVRLVIETQECVQCVKYDWTDQNLHIPIINYIINVESIFAMPYKVVCCLDYDGNCLCGSV